MSTKENPNPIIHSTNKHNHASNIPTTASPLIGSAAIRRYHLFGTPSPSNSQQLNVTTEWDNTLDYDTSSIYQWGPITAEDRSVALALSAAAHASTTDNNNEHSSTKLDILQQAGFALYNPKIIHKQYKAIQYPSFAPSKHKTKINIESTKWQTLHREEEKEEEEKRDTITPNEIFDIVRNIQDPEHPLTLEQLNVVRLELIDVVDLKGDSSSNDSDNDDVTMEEEGSSSNLNGHIRKKFSTVHVQFTPTIPHCSMATLIGLSLRVKLLRSIPSRFKVIVKIEDGTHVSEHAVNKQLADKERVRAALENEHLLGVVDRCIEGGMQMK